MRARAPSGTLTAHGSRHAQATPSDSDRTPYTSRYVMARTGPRRTAWGRRVNGMGRVIEAGWMAAAGVAT